jgi:hypothetical protein
MVADKTGLTVTALRGGKLELSQPRDGGWHFYASDPSAQVAARLASAWAEAFTAEVQQGIQTAIELDAVRKGLESNPGDANLQASIKNLEARSLAITPELQISLAQGKSLPVSRKSSAGLYAFAGAGLVLTLASLIVLFTGIGNKSA